MQSTRRPPSNLETPPHFAPAKNSSYLSPSLGLRVKYLYWVVARLFDVWSPEDEDLPIYHVRGHACLRRLEGGQLVPIWEGVLGHEQSVQGLSSDVCSTCQSKSVSNLTQFFFEFRCILGFYELICIAGWISIRGLAFVPRKRCLDRISVSVRDWVLMIIR